MVKTDNKQIIDIAKSCSDAVYNVLLHHPDFNAFKFNVGANDICDVITNKILDLLNYNK